MQANDTQVGGDHYKTSTYQHWDMAADAGLFHQEAAASKYLSRFDTSKGKPEEDLRKAAHYVEKLKELFTEGRRAPLSKLTARETMVFYCDTNGFTGPKREALLRLVTWRNAFDLSELVLLISKMLEAYNSRSEQV